MIFENENYIITNKKNFDETIKEEKENIYLYHFIIIKYKENNEIKEIKIDQLNDLNKLENKEILYKYYIRKIHYYTEPSLFYYEEQGDTYHIDNIGYFHIGGLFETNKDELKQIKEMFNNYNKNYKNMKPKYSDEEFLKNNKSITLF